ncbi:MAG TPA: secretin N-terminal domain-containing protein, partial [Pirellulales bacterium]|nr:secretin N-terminal domain-containing protein [Pirellulales bacterium]
MGFVIPALFLCGSIAAGQDAPTLTSPSSAVNRASGEQDQIVRAYTVSPPATLDEVVQRLTKQFPPNSGVRISPDGRTSQILVIAPSTVQEQVSAILQGSGLKSNSATAGPPSQTVSMHGPKVVPLKHLSWRDFEAALNGVFGKPLPVTIEHNGDWARYVLETRGGTVNLIVDRKAGQVALEGPVKLADSWARVVESLDNHPQQSNDNTRVVTLNAANTSDVIKALSALRESNSTASGTHSGNAAQSGDNAPASRFINMIFQPKDGEQNGNAAGGQATGPSLQVAQTPNQPLAQNQDQNQNPPDQNQPQPQPAPEQGGELIGPVQIEFLEGLDAIVVRGNPRDVERVMQIISDIEKISAVTRPRIEIYPLKFVNGTTL